MSVRSWVRSPSCSAGRPKSSGTRHHGVARTSRHTAVVRRKSRHLPRGRIKRRLAQTRSKYSVRGDSVKGGLGRGVFICTNAHTRTHNSSHPHSTSSFLSPLNTSPRTTTIVTVSASTGITPAARRHRFCTTTTPTSARTVCSSQLPILWREAESPTGKNATSKGCVTLSMCFTTSSTIWL